MCRLVAIIFAFCVTGAFAPPNSVSERTSDVIRICGEPAPEPGPNTATDFLYPNLDSLLHDCWQPRGRECKPNPNLGIAFDDELPYRRRVVNEETIITRDVPPPNWAELPIYMVARDSSGHLYVYFRTWLLHHNRDSPVEPRDGRIRAQLMVNLHSHIRRLWREHIDPDDDIKTTVVRRLQLTRRRTTAFLLQDSPVWLRRVELCRDCFSHWKDAMTRIN